MANLSPTAGSDGEGIGHIMCLRTPAIAVGFLSPSPRRDMNRATTGESTFDEDRFRMDRASPPVSWSGPREII